MNWKIINATLWNPNEIRKNCSLTIENGIVTSIEDGKTLSSSSIDLKGETLLPAGVDLQVHLRVPGQTHKETAETGLSAALHGGVSAILTMPNTKPVIDSVENSERARTDLSAAEKSTGVRVLLSAAMTLGQRGDELVDFRALKDWGISAFTDDGKGVENFETMEKVFAASAETGIPILQHAETPGHGASLAFGPIQKKHNYPPYLDEAEWTMVQRDLELLRKHPRARYHVLHISSQKTVELISLAKAEGLNVTGEVTPHHLLFTSSDIPDGNTSFKMNPPLRYPADREVLREALADGRIDFVSTDHAPHEKEVKGKDFVKSAFGTTGLEASLRVLLQLRNEGILSEQRLVQVFSTAPARYIGIDDQFGSISVGKAFNATWIDANAKPSAITEKDLHSLSKNSCFIGSKLPGRIKGVFNAAGLHSFKE